MKFRNAFAYTLVFGEVESGFCAKISNHDEVLDI